MKYAVLIEAREMRTAFGFNLADAVDEARGANPNDCSISIRYEDGTERFIDSSELAQPSVPDEKMRVRLIGIAKRQLAKLPIPCPPGMVNTKETWERWSSAGPTPKDVRDQQSLSDIWKPRKDVEAYEREHLALVTHR